MSRLVRWSDLDLRVRGLPRVGLLVRCAQPVEDRLALPRLGRSLWNVCVGPKARVDGVQEVVASEVEVLIRTNRDDVDILLRQIRDVLSSEQVPQSRCYELPVYFDKLKDWEFVERQTGKSRDTVIDELLRCSLTLAMLGFLPGFAYLGGVPKSLRCPRKSSPSTRVMPGTVALGGDYLGVYSLPSPGGWQCIGRTPARLFSMHRWPPMVFEVGDQVRLARIDRHEFDRLERAGGEPREVSA